ncbi:MAG TPA: LuxR C-terminal-related transcriptional regulator, partial [bacterium]|nr:LuxR C-terminal-related transcriptional regulator [bacterium]
MTNKKTKQTEKELLEQMMSERGSLSLLPVPETIEADPTKVKAALLERVKELNCLYGTAQLAEKCSESIDEFLQNLVNILPPAWQYPEVTRARITFKGKSFKSRSFKISKWRQASKIMIYGEQVGEVEIFYLEEKPDEYEGPFLREERMLIGTVAEQIGKISLRISSEMELRELNRLLTVERQSMHETNSALKTMLTRIEEEKMNVYKSVQANVEKIIMPILHALTVEIPGSQKKYVEMIKVNLEEITSPFINSLSRKYLALTPTEIKICKMIRNGLRTKEIAQVQGVSHATINRHREHI